MQTKHINLSEKRSIVRKFLRELVTVKLISGRRFDAVVEDVDDLFVIFRGRKFSSIHRLDEIQNIFAHRQVEVTGNGQ
jgi:hypothetical protein